MSPSASHLSLRREGPWEQPFLGPPQACDPRSVGSSLDNCRRHKVASYTYSKYPATSCYNRRLIFQTFTSPLEAPLIDIGEWF
eukprot:6210869-Pleurochrysis_carterae.AAC.1